MLAQTVRRLGSVWMLDGRPHEHPTNPVRRESTTRGSTRVPARHRSEVAKPEAEKRRSAAE